jgi:hypothetical protein
LGTTQDGGRVLTSSVYLPGGISNQFYPSGGQFGRSATDNAVPAASGLVVIVPAVGTQPVEVGLASSFLTAV